MGATLAGDPPAGARPDRAPDAVPRIEPHPAAAGWSFLTRHAQVLLWIARDEDARVRDIAAAVGITDRSATRIIGELVAEGYLHRVPAGRRRRYLISLDRRLHHPVEGSASVAALLAAFGPLPAAAAEWRAS
jgi:hypothetical protein